MESLVEYRQEIILIASIVGVSITILVVLRNILNSFIKHEVKHKKHELDIEAIKTQVDTNNEEIHKKLGNLEGVINSVVALLQEKSESSTQSKRKILGLSSIQENRKLKAKTRTKKVTPKK